MNLFKFFWKPNCEADNPRFLENRLRSHIRKLEQENQILKVRNSELEGIIYSLLKELEKAKIAEQLLEDLKKSDAYWNPYKHHPHG